MPIAASPSATSANRPTTVIPKRCAFTESDTTAATVWASETGSAGSRCWRALRSSPSTALESRPDRATMWTRR